MVCKEKPNTVECPLCHKVIPVPVTMTRTESLIKHLQEIRHQ